MTTRIEPAQPGDAEAMAAVINLAYRVEDFFKACDRTTVEEVRRLLERETFLVAREDDGSIAGVVRVGVEGEVGHFGMLAVAPGRQGVGLGRTLVEAAERWCRERGAATMTLEIASPRSELPRYYERLGYRVCGTRPWPPEHLHELKAPAHFILYAKSLGGNAAPEETHG